MIRTRYLVLAVITGGLVAAWVLAPRLHHSFPSLVDDWGAIESAPQQVRSVLTLGNPEIVRYRPGYILWSGLIWHTFGAPTNFAGPQIWNGLRVLLFVAGLVLPAALLTRRAASAGVHELGRWLLVVSVPIVVVTMPRLTVDLARYGPQEPLLVGCMGVGGTLIVLALDRLLASRGRRWTTLALACAGLVLWAFGVIQKETSLSALVVLPFLWPTARAQGARWARLDRPSRTAVLALGCAAALPFVPILVRTAQLVLTNSLVGDAQVDTGSGALRNLWAQAALTDDVLRTPAATAVAVAAVAAVSAAIVLHRADWVSAGLLAAALASILFAAESGIVVSRYYIPAVTLATLALVRAGVELGRRAAVALALALILIGLAQVRFARDEVSAWVQEERTQESAVRDAAGLVAGGCAVRVTGRDVELVAALPVLMPLAAEPPRRCRPGQRFVVVLDWHGPGTSTTGNDAILRACHPVGLVVRFGSVARRVRCGVR